MAPQIPQSLDEMDAEWLTALLLHGGHDVEVTQVEVRPIGTGQMATSLRVHIDYHRNLTGAPDTLVVKIASADPNSREAGARGAYLREVRYYQELDATVDVATPASMWSDIDLESNAFLLALEDMYPATQGDQIAGCSVDQARQAVENIAGLHAPRWCDPTLLDLDWLTLPRAQRAEGHAEAEVVMGALTPGFIDRYRNRISGREHELLAWFAANTAEWLATGIERYALTHADHRLDNLLFNPGSTDRPVTVVDWQTIGVRNPLADIAYLLGTGLEPAIRKATERDIVASYHGQLVARGVTDYSFDRCFDDYREQTPHALLITVLGSMMTGQTDRGDDMFMAMLRRSCQQIDDLDVV